MKFYIGDVVQSKSNNHAGYCSPKFFDSEDMIGEVVKLDKKNLYVNPVTGKGTNILYLIDVCHVQFKKGIISKSSIHLKLIKRYRINKLKRILDLD